MENIGNNTEKKALILCTLYLFHFYYHRREQSQTMKVLQLNTVCGSGSVGKITVDIYHTLNEQGHKGVILYGRNTAPENVNAIKVGTQTDFYAHALLGVVTGKGGFGSAKMTREIVQTIEKEQPDIIHLHNIHGFYVQIEYLFSYLRRADIPVVWTLHDCWSFTGHCAYFDYMGCEKWQQGCQACPQHRQAYPYSLNDYSKQAYERKRNAFQNVKNLTIVTPSKWLADLVKKSFLQEYPVQVIPNGIDLANFNEHAQGGEFRKEMGLQDKFIILGVANVWELRKGLVHFVKLQELLEKAEKDTFFQAENTKIILVGIDKHRKKKLPSSILGIEHTNGAKELAAIYQAADVYVNATLEDNFPTTNLEALSCGTPVITFATGGSPESIDQSCGLVTKTRDAEGIYQALLEIKERPPRERDCLKKGREYDKKKRFQEYICLYEKVRNREKI